MEQATYKIHALTFKKKHSRPYNVKSSIPTWRQIKALSTKGKNVLGYTGKPITPENLFLAMVAILTCTSAVSGQVYWAFIPHPPLLRLVEWSERGPIVFTNDSTYLPPPWKSTGPNHSLEEGTAMNIMNISLDMKCFLCSLVI
jgi:endonuclease/exonuclease/phosphatase (EEP) superfamily protein YafD